jgi:hypothetical protein
MADAQNGNRITVSEDKLDAKLARLELSLVDRITKALDVKADQAYVEQLHARIHTAEATIQATALLVPSFKDVADDVEARIRALERFRYAIPSLSVLGFVIALLGSIYTYFQ